MPNLGKLGEQVVAAWLRTQGWVILHHRWHCRWGEIDLIACSGTGEWENSIASFETNQRLNLRCTRSPAHPLPPSPLLVFIEVKTRSRGNWDADGLLAITPTKQAKLWRTAELFLCEHPDLENLPCRFDVALVRCQRMSGRSHPDSAPDTILQLPPVQLGQPVLVAGYRIILQDYIESAFG
ncbi:MAG: YraN family protein [Coleofasciculus sp. S288]|nr:YraN family protein [Coleofasciculus sp. S288]